MRQLGVASQGRVFQVAVEGQTGIGGVRNRFDVVGILAVRRRQFSARSFSSFKAVCVIRPSARRFTNTGRGTLRSTTRW